MYTHTNHLRGVVDLTPILGAIEYEFPDELFNQVVANMPRTGDPIAADGSIIWG